MQGADHGSGRGRALLLELFVLGNLLFLAVDVLVAHAMNDFARRVEWVPVGYSALVSWLLVPGLLRPGRRFEHGAGRGLGLAVGAGAILVGVVGMVLHMDSTFFEEQTLHNLVYTAPFAAPLSYAGLGLLLWMNRMVSAETREWGLWVVLLALGGFIGNFALSLADHAQNGFFHATEWIPVGASAFAVGFLAAACLRSSGPRFLRLALGVMGLQVLVGLLGFGLHVAANLHGEAELVPRFVHGAPAFAPLLFADLALLGTLGLWHLMDLAPSSTEAADARPAAEAADAAGA